MSHISHKNDLRCSHLKKKEKKLTFIIFRRPSFSLARRPAWKWPLYFLRSVFKQRIIYTQEAVPAFATHSIVNLDT